ncbi:MAG TPA: biopolymer transporter ExbD [Bdellovibrionota bacterium]|jgi:biopolymer transport protein ExbD|nr:biopolymer transporter ExbD [Bdellovibrionota bacterium]
MAIRPIGEAGDNEDVEGSLLSEINITPMVDVMLVLLIVFMVGSSVMSQLGVDVNLPEASNKVAQQQPEGVVITLLPEGAVRVVDVTVQAGDWDRFSQVMRLAFKNSSSHRVILEGDRKAFLGSVVELMDHARSSGADQFALAAQPTQ